MNLEIFAQLTNNSFCANQNGQIFESKQMEPNGILCVQSYSRAGCSKIYNLFIRIYLMSKQESDSHLKFGQGILIEGFKTDGVDVGFLTAQGFADIKVKYQTYDDILFFKNYRNSIFQILPAGNFELNDQLHKALIENEGQEDTPNIRILRSRAESEKYQFQLNIENNMKKKICFGQSVIFKHIDSQSYVSGTIKPSTGSNGAFTVQVSQKLSDSLVFKLMPYRSFQFLDMPIPFDSPILIKNQFNNGFVTFEKMGLAEDGSARGPYISKKPIQSNQSYSIPVKTQSQKSDVYEVVTHFVDLSCDKQVPMPWRFKLHVNDVINDTLIQHDVVYLQHTQNAGVLSSNGKNIVLKELKERETDELSFYDCLWQIQKHDATDKAYILRHLMSGMVLGQEQGQDGLRRAVLKDISGGKIQGQEISYVEVGLAKKQGGQINSQSFVNLAWGNQTLQTWDQQSALQSSIRKQGEVTGRIDLLRMNQLYKKQIEYNIRPLVFRQSVAQQHCFVIMEIEDDLKQQLLFALSFHSVIIRLREDLKYGAIEAAKKITYLKMMQVNNKVKQIKKFIKDCSDDEVEQEHIFPQTKRQMICKDLGISQLLFQLLYFMKMNLKEDIFSDKHNEKQKFLELYNTLYQVNRELIRKNYLFKMHVSKWFEFILDDVIAADIDCQLNLLKELLVDNDFFINNFVNQQIIEYLTSCFSNFSDNKTFIQKKYLQIFRLLCISGQKVNTSNQKLILDHFIKPLRQQKSIFQVRLVEEDGRIKVIASLDKSSPTTLPFSEFHDLACQQYPSAWAYFVEYLNLIADLAQGRNKITEQELATIYTLPLLSQLFQNEKLHEAQVPIIRLIHYLYAQSQKYYPIEKRRKLLSFNALVSGDQVTINCTNAQKKPWLPPLDKIMVRLLNRLKQFAESGPIKTKATAEQGQDEKVVAEKNAQIYKNNLVLHTLLKFLWETVNLGFWSNKESVRDILTQVLKICSIEEGASFEGVQIQTKENILMIQCKMECLKIIDLIAEIDNDVLVQNIAAKFKDLEFPPKKFNLKGMLGNSPILQIKCDNELVANYLQNLPDEVAIQPIIDTGVIDQMIQMSNYKNARLTDIGISIIERVLQTRKKAFEQFSQLIIISEDERLQLVQFMESHRNKFFTLDDPGIINVTEDNQNCNYYLIYDKEQNGLMEVLYLLTELMKNQNSVLQIDKIKNIHDSGVFEALGTQRLINFTGERSSTSRMKQQIVYSSNLHTKVLNFIFACKDMPESQLGVKLLHMCYYFIVALIENFNQIKAIMQWHIPKMIHHISKNVGCIDFLKEMYDNNKTMLYNQMTVFQLIKQICQNIEKQSSDSYYKSKLLDFFRYLIYCNGRCLKTHQIQILKIMQDDSYNNIMVHLDIDIHNLVKQYEQSNVDSETTEMSPQLTYICTFFQIASSLIDCNNSVNIGKFLKKYPFDKLVEYLSGSGTCWPLRRNLRAFINRLYYFQPGLDTLLKPILSYELPNIISDLNLYIGQKHKENVSIVQNKKFKNPVRFSYLESYHYLLIEQNLFTIINLISKDKVVQQMVKYLNNYAKADLDSSYNWFKITERLAWLQKYFTSNKNVYSNSMIKFILSKVKPMLFLLEQPYIFHRKIPEGLSNDSNIFKSQKDIFIGRLLQGNIGDFFQQNSELITDREPLTFHVQFPERQQRSVVKVRDENRLKQALRVIFRREKKDFQNEDQRINYNLQQLISSVKLSAQVQNYTLEEYKNKVGTYYQRPDRYDFIKRIIQLNSRDPAALTPQRKHFFLLFITGLVEASNKNAPPAEESQQPQFKTEIDQWQAEYWSESKKQVEQTQTELKRCELGRFIVDLLKEDIINDIELANSILLCAIAYMLGGNPVTQKNLLEQLENDEENKVFANIEALIFKLGKLIRKNIDESNTQKQQQLPGSKQFTVDMVDNYDFFDVSQKYVMRKNVSEPNSTDEYLYGKICITTYRRAFKFLQILCQSNNVQGKHIIRAQPGKARQYNFIDITTKQLRNLFQIYCYQIRIVPLFLLDFILEVTQIPIYENQTALMNSTFFQDLCQLKNSFTFPSDSPDDQARNKKLNECNFKDLSDVEQIFYKSFKIILSNFQGNDKKMFVTLDNKLQSKFLALVLKQKLTSMGIQTNSDLVNHINNYSNQQQEDGSKNTDLDQDILIVLDIITIFMKIKGVLGNSSRIIKSYEKFKKEEAEVQRLKIYGQNNENVDLNTPDRQNVINQKTDQEMANYKCLYISLQKMLLSIEVTDQKGTDQTVYFPKYPVFDSLAGNLRDFIMRQVNRSSHRDKIVSLLSYTEGVKNKIEYSYQLKKKQGITQASMTDSFNVASILSCIICAYILVFYNVNIEYQEAEYYSQFTLAAGRFVLSFTQLIFTILYFFYWFQLKLWQDPITISRGQNPQAQEQSGEEAPAIQEAENAEADQEPPAAPSLKDNILNHVKTYYQTLQGWFNAVSENLGGDQQKWYKSSQFLRNSIFLFGSVVGTFYFPPMFFLHLMIIFTLNQKLGTILQSAVFNLKSLIFISFMGVVFTIVFCTVTFSNYMKNVYSPSDDPAEMCDGVLNCVSQLYVSGAIGETMQEFEIIRFIYDIIYITFFDTMFSNIVSGLMLDAFSSLREESEARADDKENFCYICNISREALQKQGIDFTIHTRNQHFLWNYIFYIYILQRKDQTDYTGLQYYIRKQYYRSDEEMEVYWIPNKGESEFDVQTEAQLVSDHISGQLQNFNEKHTALQASINEFRQLAKQYLQ